MKACLITSLFLASLAPSAAGREITFAWDPQAAAGFIIERLDPVTERWVRVGESPSNGFTASDLPEEAFDLRVTAFSDSTFEGKPAGRLLSPPSANLTVPATPAAPKGLTIELQTSGNLKEWKPMARHFVDADEDKRFFRLVIHRAEQERGVK